MKRFILLSLVFLMIFSCKSTDTKKESTSKTAEKNEKIPGIATVMKFGVILDSSEVLNRVGKGMGQFIGGNVAQAIYNDVLNLPIKKEVYVVESVIYNENKLATEIKGYVKTASSFRDYVISGGLGIPVYEAAEPNEFGMVFGRSGNIATRDGIIVRLDPLKVNVIYDTNIGSETYDKVSEASVLFQAFQAARTPYLENMIIELEGMILNSDSKDAMLEGIKQFKAENPDKNDQEIMVEYLLANKSYLDMLKKSDKESMDRIKKGGQLINAIATACTFQSIALVKHFANMTLEITSIVLSPSKIANYVVRNVPKDRNMTFNDLQEIQKYGRYQLNKYNENLRNNEELWENVNKLQAQL